MKSLSALLLGFLMASCANSAKTQTALTGQWQSEAVPTGYWIIDRHPDGKYAMKRYLNHDSSKPAEIAIEWGRWKATDKKYSTIIDGSTSDWLNRFSHKWTSTKIRKHTADTFIFDSSDGEDFHESKISDPRPLLELEIYSPNKETHKEAIDTIKEHKDIIPLWIDATLIQPMPNQALQLTPYMRHGCC